MPANKVIVGVSSHGRAFKRKDPNCKGDMCEYTGTASVSEALPGPCTRTRGYIANAEIEEFIAIQADQFRPDDLRKQADVVAVLARTRTRGESTSSALPRGSTTLQDTPSLAPTARTPKSFVVHG
jgi:hypothetical protein